jgi:preprotein translocase subunit SecG
MGFIIGVLLTVQVITCIFLVLIVLMQPSKADGGLGAAFGAGATDTLFGARTGNVLTKATVWSACIIFVTSLLLAILIAHQKTSSPVLDKVVPTPPTKAEKAATPDAAKKEATKSSETAPAKDAPKSAAPAKSAPADKAAEKPAEKPAAPPAPAKK